MQKYFAKNSTRNWSEEVFLAKKLKNCTMDVCNRRPWQWKIVAHKRKNVIKKKGDNLYVTNTFS